MSRLISKLYNEDNKTNEMTKRTYYVFIALDLLLSDKKTHTHRQGNVKVKLFHTFCQNAKKSHGFQANQWRHLLKSNKKLIYNGNTN